MDVEATHSNQRLKLHGSRLEFDQPNENHELRDGWQWLFATFNDYLQPDSTMSPDEAIRLATKYFDYGDLGMFAVYSVAIVLGDQIPYDNPAQSKLGHFLIAFLESDEWLSSPNLERGYSASMLRRRLVERVNIALHEDYIDPGLRVGDGEDPMDYVNCSAFIANVIAWDTSSYNLIYYTAELQRKAFMCAFELRHEREEAYVRDTWVMGAAQHIKWCGHKVYWLVCKRGDPTIKQDEDQSEWWDQGPYTLQDWRAWQEGFRTAANNEMYGARCRQIAADAVEIMVAHEKGTRVA